MIDEVYKSKQGYEYEKLKCAYLEKKIQMQMESKTSTEENSQENEKKLKKIKENEDKVEVLTKELEEQRAKTEKYQKMVNKKDFFREYDCMCKEVKPFSFLQEKLNGMGRLKGSESRTTT